MLSIRWPRRGMRAVCGAGAALAVLAAAGCSGSAEPAPPPSASATPSSAASASGADRLAVLDPTVITGLTSVVDESLEQGEFTYVTFPVVPGAEAWTEQLRADLAPTVARFREVVPGSDQPPYPELHVAWDLVGASPEAIGVRLVTSEVGPDEAFTGQVRTGWWDPALGQERGVRDLFGDEASAEFFQRLTAAALADPDVVAEQFYGQRDGEWESFDSIGFTPSGDLWVEFDRRQISDVNDPVGIVVDPEGLLSEFGEAARAAALDPRDPALVGPAPGEPASAEPTPGAGSSSAPTAISDVDCGEQKCAALTFDDGPVAETSELLDLLAEKDVRATFFTVGSNVEVHPEIVARMVAEGHVVGNHTLDHHQLTRLDAAGVRSEIESTNDLIEQATGQRPTLLRPPYGATNATVRRVAAELGMSQVNWNVDPEDWKDRDTAIVTRRVLADTRRGSIVLSHDIHATTRAAYAEIVDGLRDDGFVLVTVPELFGGELEPGTVYYNR